MNKNKNKRPKNPMAGPNPALVKADQERRRSGAAGAHDSRPNRQRSRADAKRAAIGAGW